MLKNFEIGNYLSHCTAWAGTPDWPLWLQSGWHDKTILIRIFFFIYLHLTLDMWHMTGNIWHVTCDSWHVTGDMWAVSQNSSSLALTVWELWCLEDLEKQEHSVTQFMTKLFEIQPRLHWIKELLLSIWWVLCHFKGLVVILAKVTNKLITLSIYST